MSAPLALGQLAVALSELDQALFADLCYLVLALAVLLVAKLTLELLTPFGVDDELTVKDNPAFGVSLVGYYLGVLIVFTGSVHEQEKALEGQPFLLNLAADAAWALGAVLLLNLARLLLDRVVLRGFSTQKEIVADRNVGVGAVELGTYVASALVIAGALTGHGEEAGVLSVLAFFALGQLALVLLSVVYQRLTVYDLHEQLEADNAAAGIAYAGSIIACGVILMRGAAGELVSWEDGLLRFGAHTLVALLLVGAGRAVIDRVLLPGRTLAEEIAEDKNVNAGLLEGGLLVGFAALVAFAT